MLARGPDLTIHSPEENEHVGNGNDVGKSIVGTGREGVADEQYIGHAGARTVTNDTSLRRSARNTCIPVRVC